MTEDAKIYETTPEHFELFRAEAQRFIDLFGLLDWYVLFAHREGGASLADINANYFGKSAEIGLFKEWAPPDIPSDDLMRHCAFHEVMELLLVPMRKIALDPDMNRQEKKHALDVEAHAIIRRLENVVLPRLK